MSIEATSQMATTFPRNCQVRTYCATIPALHNRTGIVEGYHQDEVEVRFHDHRQPVVANFLREELTRLP